MENMWVKMTITILGGLGIFLYGIRVMSYGLESTAGEKMRWWLQKFTKNPISGVFTGIFVTTIIKSSSAASERS